MRKAYEIARVTDNCAQGGPDAFVGMIGLGALGCIQPGQLCLITGSSHLHCVVSSKPTTAEGTWGAYRGAPLPGTCFAEGGQSSTGSIVRWAKNMFGEEYATLDREASKVPPGCQGLVALETFQGSRTPVTDPLARGALIGLTLSHTRAHVWRALLESVCFGTRACVEALANAGHQCNEIVLAGGITRSPLWLQMHADVTGKPIVVCENADAPLLGCAVLAAVAAGIHDSVEAAVKCMVRTVERIEPGEGISDEYTKLFEQVYSRVSPATRPIVHSIAALRGGSSSSSTNPPKIVSPSLLASDWSKMGEEVQRCIEAGANHLHVDIFDGVYLDSPYALTFGPQMVQAICRSAASDPTAIIDLHVCVDRPGRFVEPLAKAGGSRFIFQWEAVRQSDPQESVQSASALARAVVASGMRCGVSINPENPIDELFPLLQTGLVDLVDILAVAPGFGGQKFQPAALEKVKQLNEWRWRTGSRFSILVDGGVSNVNSPELLEAGADILVAGTFLFGHPSGLSKGVDELLNGKVAQHTKPPFT